MLTEPDSPPHSFASHASRSLRCGMGLICLSLVLAACARPSNEGITTFATATKALATSAQEAATFNAAINQRVRIAEAAKSYAAGAPVDVSSKASGIMGSSGTTPWQSVKTFLKAVSAYAEALEQLNDPRLVTGVSSGVTGLGSAGAGIASQVSASASLPAQITAVGAIAGDITQISLELHTTQQISLYMQNVQHQLRQAAPLLARIIKAIQKDSVSLLKDYNGPILEALDRSRDTTKPASGEEFQRRYELYTKLVTDREALAAQNRALANLPKAIDQMVEAHAAIIESLNDPVARSTAVVSFAQTVGDIASQISALRALSSKTE